MREGVVGLSHEATSAHEISFLSVISVIACDVISAGKAGGSIEVAGGGVGGGVANVIVAGGGESGGEGGLAILIVAAGGEIVSSLAEFFGFDFLLCFVRTCSCSLVSLTYLAEQRLHSKTSSLRFLAN